MMKGGGIAGKLAVLALCASCAAAAKGRLVVFLVVDQLRYQDVLWLAPEWGPKGFASLGKPVAMRYQTVVTETAADHAVLSTGAYAELNGIIANRFVTDNTQHEMVEDEQCAVWGAPKIGKSAAMLRVPTVGDALKLGTNGRAKSVAVAIKDRAALFLGGPTADLAVFLEADAGRMTSTTCYAPEAPQWLARLNEQHPLAEYKDWLWQPENPALVAKYAPQQETEGATPWEDIGPEFPHRVGKGAVDKRLATVIRETPPGTELGVRTARAAIEGMHLGEGDATDFLQLSVPSVDYIGHQFGTVSRERVDALWRVHTQLSAFVEWLRAKYGPRVSFMLTADHGLTAMASDQRRLRMPKGGTLDLDDLTAKLNGALDQALGARPEGWVFVLDGNELWLRKPYPTRALQLAAETLRKEPGVLAAVTRDEIGAASLEVRHSYFPGRSGDITVVPRPLWVLKKASHGADHGSPWNDDSLVPLFLSAPGFKLHKGATIRATQVAPALAELLQVSPPAAAFDDPAIDPE